MNKVRVFDGDLSEELAVLLQKEAREDGLAVDIETTGLTPKTSRLAVVSVATPKSGAVIQITDGKRPYRLGDLLEDFGILKIFHHALFDLTFLKATWGFVIEPIFCTKVAARIAGVGLNPTLEDLVLEIENVQLDKSQRMSDWQSRPLTREQVEYAITDVQHLHSLRRQLQWKLSDVGNSALFNSAMEFINARAQLELMGLRDVFAYKIPSDNE